MINFLENLNEGWNDMRQYCGTAHIDLPYQLYKPKNFDSSRKYPVLLYMHGMGSCGDDNLKHITIATASVIPHLTESEYYSSNVIIIAPHCPRGVQWVDWNAKEKRFNSDNIAEKLALAFEIFDYCFANMLYDESRVYLWGNSMGAFAAFDMMQRFPNRFAGAVAVAGFGKLELAHKIAKNNIWIHHGDVDTLVPYVFSEELYNELKRLGAGDNIRLTAYPEQGHSIFAEVGNNEDVISWLFSQKKVKND